MHGYVEFCPHSIHLIFFKSTNKQTQMALEMWHDEEDVDEDANKSTVKKLMFTPLQLLCGGTLL